MQRSRTALFIGAAMAVSLAVATPASADDGPSLDPAEVEATIFPGDSFDVEKTVITPAIPPDPEVYFLVDTTGSMGSVIDQAKADVTTIIADIVAEQPTAEFGLGQYKDFPFDPFAYQHMVSIGGDVPTAVGTLSAGGGADGSEGQFYALDQIAKNNTAGFSGDDGSTPVIVWVGDAPAHDPVCAAISGLAYDITEASVTADLMAAGYTVVALSTTTGYPDGLDDNPTLSAGNYTGACGAPGGAAGQATRISDATGGTTLTNVEPEDVAQAVLDALSAVEVSVSMTSDCAETTGGVIDTTFDPDSQDVESGDAAIFLETISVAADAPGGIYTCLDWALIDGEPMTNPDAVTEDNPDGIVYETKTILVPENFVTGGGHITEGKGKNRSSVNFGGNAGYMEDGSLVGHWVFNFKNWGDVGSVKIHTTEVTRLQFYDFGGDPAPPEADADTAAMVATARVSVDNGPWEEGCTVHAVFVDGGEPQDDGLLSFDVDCGSGAFVAEDLTGGNIQMHDGTKG